jgi:alcohol dehydrogenase
MKAAVFHEHGPTQNIKTEDFPDPEIGPADCLVKVNAVALNGFEPMILRKETALRTPLPMIPGGDIAGEIVELGADVDPKRWKIGDRVSIYPLVKGEGMTGESRLGGCCEFVRIPADYMIPIPDGLGDVEAASLPIAYGTALRMMVTKGAVQKGETVLVLGATGGVGTACVQLAHAAGCEVIACGSADWKIQRLRELGADHVINTAEQDIREFVYETYGKPRMGEGGGVDVVVNYIGGDTWLECLKIIHPGGRMLTCGASAGYATDNDLRYIWTYEISIVGSNAWTPEDQAEMMRMVVDGEIKPVIHAVRPWSETAASIQQLIDRDFFGKIVLQP